MTHILLAEDNLSLLEDLTRELELSDYKVQQAVSGEDLFDKLAHITRLPDLIVADLMLGDVDSIQLLDQLQQPDWRCIPMIFMCPFNAPDIAIIYKRLQPDEYLLKPFHVSVMMRAITKRLNDSISLV